MKPERLGKLIKDLVKKAAFILPKDAAHLIRKAYLSEKNKKAKKALGWILENSNIAKNDKLAICQDTGLPIVFIEAGKNKSINSDFIDLITKSVEEGYKENYLRPWSLDPIKRGTPKYKNTIVHCDFSSRQNGIKVIILPKGFGSENKSAVKMFNPTADIKDIQNFVVDAVRLAGPEVCPPFFIGVGIGATADEALLLAKKALLEELDKPNPDKKIFAIEKELLAKINKLGIGPMGLGGKNTALAVRIKTAATHIAGLPVGVSISCHALRKATITI